MHPSNLFKKELFEKNTSCKLLDYSLLSYLNTLESAIYSSNLACQHRGAILIKIFNHFLEAELKCARHIPGLTSMLLIILYELALLRIKDEVKASQLFDASIQPVYGCQTCYYSITIHAVNVLVSCQQLNIITADELTIIGNSPNLSQEPSAYLEALQALANKLLQLSLPDKFTLLADANFIVAPVLAAYLSPLSALYDNYVRQFRNEIGRERLVILLKIIMGLAENFPPANEDKNIFIIQLLTIVLHQLVLLHGAACLQELIALQQVADLNMDCLAMNASFYYLSGFFKHSVSYEEYQFFMAGKFKALPASSSGHLSALKKFLLNKLTLPLLPREAAAIKGLFSPLSGLDAWPANISLSYMEEKLFRALGETLLNQNLIWAVKLLQIWLNLFLIRFDYMLGKVWSFDREQLKRVYANLAGLYWSQLPKLGHAHFIAIAKFYENIAIQNYDKLIEVVDLNFVYKFQSPRLSAYGMDEYSEKMKIHFTYLLDNLFAKPEKSPRRLPGRKIYY